jgi:hypothetical protein
MNDTAKDLLRVAEHLDEKRPRPRLGFGPFREDYATDEAYQAALGGPVVIEQQPGRVHRVGQAPAKIAFIAGNELVLALARRISENRTIVIEPIPAPDIPNISDFMTDIAQMIDNLCVPYIARMRRLEDHILVWMNTRILYRSRRLKPNRHRGKRTT